MRECPLAIARLWVRGRSGGRWALVPADLYPALIKHAWYAHVARKCVYVRSWKMGHRREYLHHAVKRLRRRRKPTKDHVVRHLSGDTFDNTDENLRWGTRKRNLRDVPYRNTR